MKIALGIFRLLPAGGLERHALSLAAALVERGHRVVLYTTRGAETVTAGVETVTFAQRARANHVAMKMFSARFAAATRDFDFVIGLQKLEGLDVLFCADWCYADRPRPSWQRFLPRYRTMAALERACFAPQVGTRIIALALPQLAAYVRFYATPYERLAVLPPTIESNWQPFVAPSPERRAALRAQYGLGGCGAVWLWVGLQPHVKGLDRVFAALAKRPDAHLIVCGAEKTSRPVVALMARARRSGFAGRIRLFGFVSDRQALADLFAASDLLVHPARLDVTGMVILEAIVSGLPVITTSNCGFSVHVTAADGGMVLPAPFDPASLDEVLATADTTRRSVWSANCLAYGSRPALFSGLAQAVDLIEAAAQASDAAWVAAGGLSGPLAETAEPSQ